MTNSLYQTDWWLDATAKGRWDAVTVMRGQDVAARMPFVKREIKGMVHVGQPQLTQTLGPWVRPSTAKMAKALADEKDFLNELIDGLPKFDFFSQRFHHSVTNWLPFYWRGFEQTTRYTYVLDDLDNEEALWSGLAENIRREIRKAEKQVQIVSEPSVDRLLQLTQMTYERQGKSSKVGRALLESINSACAARDCRRMMFAQDEAGKTHAAMLLVWDERSSYYVLGGGDPALRNSGATSLLMWEAIKFASGVTKRFDFEGSMVEPIERFFRSFGARQVPYSHVTGYSKKGRIIQSGRRLALALRGRTESA